MINFTKPKNLNGAELLAELKAGDVTINDFPIVENDNFWLDIAEADKAKAAPIVAAHNGTMVAPEPSVTHKLESVGLSVADLREALGL
jgi:hypothetical protein